MYLLNISSIVTNELFGYKSAVNTFSIVELFANTVGGKDYWKN